MPALRRRTPERNVLIHGCSCSPECARLKNTERTTRMETPARPRSADPHALRSRRPGHRCSGGRPRQGPRHPVRDGRDPVRGRLDGAVRVARPRRGQRGSASARRGMSGTVDRTHRGIRGVPAPATGMTHSRVPPPSVMPEFSPLPPPAVHRQLLLRAWAASPGCTPGRTRGRCGPRATGSRPCPTWNSAAPVTVPAPSRRRSAHTGPRPGVRPGTVTAPRPAWAARRTPPPEPVTTVAPSPPDSRACPDAVPPHLSWAP